jgi:hypothetical protein
MAHDSIKSQNFQDKNQIMMWSHNQLPFSSVNSEDVQIKDCNIAIIMVSGCSGIPCWRFFIFKEKDSCWQLITSSDGRFKKKIEIKVDFNQEKIIFNSEANQIGEVPFALIVN